MRICGGDEVVRRSARHVCASIPHCRCVEYCHGCRRSAEGLLSCCTAKCYTKACHRRRLPQSTVAYAQAEQGARGGRIDEDAKILVLHPVTIVEPIITDSQILLSQILFLSFCFQVHGGETHPKVAQLYNSISIVYYSQGKVQEALEQLHRAFEIRIRVLGKDHPDVANTGENIAIVYQEQGKLEEALEIYELALATQIRVCGQDHPNVATSYNNIGVVYDRQGKYEEALVQYSRALEIKIRVLGQDYLDVAASYNNIGNAYGSQGKYEEALVQYRLSLDIKIRVVGNDHLDVAESYNNIGVVYEKQSDYENALVQQGRALEIRIRVLGQDHPNVATSYYNMACAHAPHDNLLCRDMLLKAERIGFSSQLKGCMATNSDLDVVRESDWFKDLILRL